MEVRYDTHKVFTLTGADEWDNRMLIATAAFACHGKGSVFNDPDTLIRRYAFDLFPPHDALLEFSNVELKIGNPAEGDTSVRNFRTYFENLNLWGSGAPIDGYWNGSLRDIQRILQCDYKALMKFNDEGGELWGLPAVKINIPHTHPKKRVMLFIVTNWDNARKWRTESGYYKTVYQLSLSGTSVDPLHKFIAVVDDPDEFEKSDDSFIWRAVHNYREYKDHKCDYYEDEGFDLKEARRRAKYDAKHYIPTWMMNMRVMVGTHEDLLLIHRKRMQSPQKKTDVHDLSLKVLEELDEWKTTGKPSMLIRDIDKEVQL